MGVRVRVACVTWISNLSHRFHVVNHQPLVLLSCAGVKMLRRVINRCIPMSKMSTHFSRRNPSSGAWRLRCHLWNQRRIASWVTLSSMATFASHTGRSMKGRISPLRYSSRCDFFHLCQGISGCRTWSPIFGDAQHDQWWIVIHGCICSFQNPHQRALTWLCFAPTINHTPVR